MNKRPVDSLTRTAYRPPRLDLAKQQRELVPRRHRELVLIEDVKPKASSLATRVSPFLATLLSIRPLRARRLLLLGAYLICGFIALYSLGFGELLVAIYLVISVFKKIPSRTAFVLALISLVGVVLMQIIAGGESNIGDNIAVYAFLLLSVGTILAILELRGAPREPLPESN